MSSQQSVFPLPLVAEARDPRRKNLSITAATKKTSSSCDQEFHRELDCDSFLDVASCSATFDDRSVISVVFCLLSFVFTNNPALLEKVGEATKPLIGGLKRNVNHILFQAGRYICVPHPCAQLSWVR